MSNCVLQSVHAAVGYGFPSQVDSGARAGVASARRHRLMLTLLSLCGVAWLLGSDSPNNLTENQVFNQCTVCMAASQISVQIMLHVYY